MCVRVREHENPVMPVDDPFPAPRVARQARVADGVDLASADAVTHFEACFGIRFRTSVTRSLRNSRRQVRNCEWRPCLLGTGCGLAGVDLLLCHESMLHQQSDVPHQPSLVIAHAQIIGRGELLDRVTASVNVPLFPRTDRAINCVDPALPFFVEYGLVFVMLNRAHPVHPAHIMNAVHGFPPPGAATLATPDRKSTRLNSSHPSISY